MKIDACEVLVEVEEALADVVSAELFALGASAVEVRDREGLQLPNVILPPEGKAWLLAGFDHDTPAVLERELRAAFADESYALSRLEARLRDDTDWATKWKEFFHPLKIGRAMWVAPSWEPPPARAPGDIVITIDPEMAFGTGQHATTRLCLEMVERFADARPIAGARVLDVGTGSGILAIGAALSGAKAIVAIDNDEVSVETARVNAERNHITGIDFRFGALPEDAPSGVYDLILANILADPLVFMAETLRALLAPGGELVLSGLMVDQAERVLAAYTARGLTLKLRRDEGEWSALVLG
jgi:ribosomal protein L11 methyltransferase